MKKKVLSLLLTLCLAMTFVPMAAFAEGTSVDNWDGSAVVLHLLFSVSSSITLNYRVKSGSRVNYALFSDFFFCGKGDRC